MKTLYHIYAGLGGGFGGAVFSRVEWCKDEEEATQLAYEDAVAEYQSYEGYHGIMDQADIADDNGLDLEEDADEIEEMYQEEVESWIDYYAIPAMKDCRVSDFAHVDEMITSFSGEFEFLSNFFPATIEYKGILYATSEAAFQAAKTDDYDQKMAIAEAKTPGRAKCLGRTCTLRPDWEQVKIRIMGEIVKAKFDQHPELKEKLLATDDKILVEGNDWHDDFWGISCTCVDSFDAKYHNVLGVILYMLREFYREGPSFNQ